MRRVIGAALAGWALFAAAGLAIAREWKSSADAALQIVFRTVDFNEFFGSHVLIMKADGSEPQDLAVNGYLCSPNGRYLLIWTDGVRVINADGTGLRSVSPEIVSLTHQAISNAGDVEANILDSGNQAASLVSEVKLFPQTEVHFPFPVSGGDVALSPDYTRIAFVENGSAGRIQVMNLDDADTVEVTESGKFPVWSPDGRMILWLSPDNLLYITDIARDLSFKLTAADGSGRRGRRTGRRSRLCGTIRFSPLTPMAGISAS
jgi:WD40 repeat protein